MKVIMYEPEVCRCVAAKSGFLLYQIELEYRNITENTTNLKEFLAFRDHERCLPQSKQTAKSASRFYFADGSKTLP